MNSNILKLMVCATIPVALLSCKKDEEPVKTDYIISQYENNELPEKISFNGGGHSKSMSKSIPSRNPTSKYSSRGNTASSSAERRRRQ